MNIEKRLGEDFAPNSKMARALEAWAATIVGPEASAQLFDGVKKTKWLFISLPTVSKSAGAWTADEVAATVEDYFVMLREELNGEPYNKAAHRTRLIRGLNGRSGPAVEFKHCNISAVLEDQFSG